MQNTTFFSIIVPVYKVEPYLEKCVRSVLNQTFTDFELILVDDGSPDRSPAICDELAKSDARIRVIHKNNGGASTARNAALAVAKGTYISFLDADDFWLNESVLYDIYSLIRKQNAEIVVIKAINYYQNSDTFSETYNSFLSKDLEPDHYELNLYRLISASAYRANAWNKVFLRELMERNNLFFTEGTIAEDVDWAARLCLAARSITILDNPVYAYRTGRPGSVTSKLSIKNLIDTRDSIIRCISYVKDQELSAQFKNAFYSYVAYRYVIWMAESFLVKDVRKKPLIREMKKYAWLLDYGGIKRVERVRFLYHAVGFRGASAILGIYLKRKQNRKEQHGKPNDFHADV